jgi:hypothetical protein
LTVLQGIRIRGRGRHRRRRRRDGAEQRHRAVCATRSALCLASRDIFHGLDHDFFLPCGMAGFGGVWAGDSARPGITEQKNMVGPGFCPRRGDPHETRPIPPGTGITERGLVGLRFEEELQNEKPVSSPSVGLNYKAFVSDAGRQGFQAEERRQSGSLGSLFPSILPIPSSLSATDTSSSDLRRKGAKSNPDPDCASPTRCD